MTARSECSDLTPLLQSFFTDKLMRQRQASPNTIAAYRDAFTLLLGFASTRTRRQPAQLGLADLDAPTVGAFLQYLQTERGNTAATATHGWPRSTRSSATRYHARPNTPRSSNACWLSRPNDSTARSSTT